MTLLTMIGGVGEEKQTHLIISEEESSHEVMKLEKYFHNA